MDAPAAYPPWEEESDDVAKFGYRQQRFPQAGYSRFPVAQPQQRPPQQPQPQPPQAALPQQVARLEPSQYPDVVREMLMHIQNLYHQDTRERAILTLSKKREKFTLLGPTLWYSVGVMAIFLQEIVSMYPLLNTPSSAPVKPIINRVSSVLTLLQVIAQHDASRRPFMESNICLFLYPFLRATPAERSEVLRLTSLGVIGALVKADDPAIISYLLNTEIFPICLKIMEQAIEISKIISTFIIQKLLMSDQGLVYACQNPSRFTAVADVLHRMVAEKGPQNEHVCGPRLLKHIIRCYLRLSENERAREALPKILPEELRNNTFQEYLDEDINMRKWLLQLLVNIGDEGMQSKGVETGGYKPSLRVDIGSADNAKEESANVTEGSPQKAITPHVSTNIFVAGIPSTWDDDALRERYKEFGEIVSTKVVKNRHFGFVMFRKAESAHAAINATHLTQPTPNCGTVLHVSIAMHDEGLDDQPNDRLFIRGLPQWATKEHLRQMFSPYGVITECAVLMNPLGQCKGSGFVQFSSQQEATAAIKARDSISMDNWPHQLEVKYSESAEVRQMRQERNRNRQRHWLPSPQYRGGNTPSSLPSPYPGFSPPLSLIPSPQAFPVMSAMPFPLVYPPTPATTGAPTQIVYPQPIYQTIPPFYSASAVPIPAPIPLPQKGDLHFSGPPLTEELLRLMLHSYGEVEAVKKLDSDTGIAVRLRDVTKHALVVQQLNGSLFPTGQLLAVGMYA